MSSLQRPEKCDYWNNPPMATIDESALFSNLLDDKMETDCSLIIPDFINQSEADGIYVAMSDINKTVLPKVVNGRCKQELEYHMQKMKDENKLLQDKIAEFEQINTEIIANQHKQVKMTAILTAFCLFLILMGITLPIIVLPNTAINNTTMLANYNQSNRELEYCKNVQMKFWLDFRYQDLKINMTECPYVYFLGRHNFILVCKNKYAQHKVEIRLIKMHMNGSLIRPLYGGYFNFSYYEFCALYSLIDLISQKVNFFIPLEF